MYGTVFIPYKVKGNKMYNTMYNIAYNPYGVNCSPVYFGDLNLEIKKGFGTYCQGEKYDRNFCLTLLYNSCLELVNLFIVGMCDIPMGGYGEPIVSYGFNSVDMYIPAYGEELEDVEIMQTEVVGAKITYVLGPGGGEYVVVYARYATPSPYGYGPTVVDVARRGIYPTDAVIKRFRVVDPNYAEVLDSWSCSGYGCKEIESAFRKMCEDGGASTPTMLAPLQPSTVGHKEEETTSQQTSTYWLYRLFKRKRECR